MSRLYSKRLLWPFIGVVQVVELDRARALSLDGITWALSYVEDEEPQMRNGPLWYHPQANCSVEVSISGEQVEILDDNSDLSSEQVDADSQRLLEALRPTKLPFAAADPYEYWLLDEKDERPLALLYSCINEEEMQQPAPPPEWRALPERELAVLDPRAAQQDSTPSPVYYRLQQQVKTRAGAKPKAAWFQRTDGNTDDFPALLLREDWEDEEAQRLCELYLRSLAPRLLMLSDLPAAKREWLEQAAGEHGADVERFYRVYPETVDQSFINAARVRARMEHTD